MSASSSPPATHPTVEPIPRFPWRTVVALWLGWYVALLVFQPLVWARFTLDRPDRAYPWTGDMTPGYADGPATGPWFYARWDSPRYVRIARDGYRPDDWAAAPHLPVYPALMRAVYEGLVRPVGLGEWDTGRADAGYALAGLLVSGGMSLAAALALAALAWDHLGAGDAVRAAFVLLTFPTAFYMAQVYTEATYLALALGGLWLAYRWRWLPAAVLFALAALTRAVGVLLVLPYLGAWLGAWWDGHRPPRWALAGAVIPVAAFVGWLLWLDARGLDMFAAQARFGREVLSLRALGVFFGDLLYTLREPMAVHILLDLALTLLAAVACVVELRRRPGLALYGLGALAMGVGSGQLVSMNRYALAVVPLFLVLTRWGRRPAFDRVWTVVSLLWFALYVVLYVHGFWVG